MNKTDVKKMIRTINTESYNRLVNYNSKISASKLSSYVSNIDDLKIINILEAFGYNTNSFEISKVKSATTKEKTEFDVVCENYVRKLLVENKVYPSDENIKLAMEVLKEEMETQTMIPVDSSEAFILLPKYAQFNEDIEQLIDIATKNASHELDKMNAMPVDSLEKAAAKIEISNLYVENKKALDSIKEQLPKFIRTLVPETIEERKLPLTSVFALAKLLYKRNVFTSDKEVNEVIKYMIPDGHIDVEDNTIIFHKFNVNAKMAIDAEVLELKNSINAYDREMLDGEFYDLLARIIRSIFILTSIASLYEQQLDIED